MLWAHKGLCAGLFLGLDFVDIFHIFHWFPSNFTVAKLEEWLPIRLFCGKAVKLLFPTVTGLNAKLS